MYSMVMMMAVATSGDAASFGGKRASCQGSVAVASCHGAPVASCHGSAPASGCYGSTSSGHGLFSKLKGRGGKHNRGNSCHGSAPVATPECCTPCDAHHAGQHVVSDPCALPGHAIVVSPMAVQPKVMPKAEEPKAEPKKVEPKVEPKKTETKKES